MHSYSDKVRGQIVTTYDALISEQEILDKLRREAGWRMRNAVISHVNSGYNQHQNVLAKSMLCEDSIQRCNKNKQITNNIKRQINAFNRYQKLENKIKELDLLISKYTVSGKLDVAVVLKKWRDRLKSSTGVI
jgi:hypothetical protein